MACSRTTLALLVTVAACSKDGGDDDAAGTGTTTADTTAGPTTMTGMTVEGGTTEPADASTAADTTDTNADTTTGPLACPYTPVDGTPAMGLQRLASGFDRPVLALGHPTEPDRLFVVEQGGAIRILEPDATMAPADAFLELEVSCGGNDTIGCEKGLLGLAFHPDFPTDPRVYVAYNPNVAGESPTRVSEFMLADDDHADPDSERIVIDAAQPAGNHNGGMIGFGPDGLLYIGLGDGGNSNDDPQQTGRDPAVILAKILRIDPEPDGTPDMPVACDPAYCDRPGPFDYTIPADNPFVADAAFTPEVYAWGFRNPWRFSWDLETGDLWVGDVGQGTWEEIDLVTAGGDYGWSLMEGNHCFQDSDCDDTAMPGQPNADGMIAPIVDYVHGGGSGEGCSVTGGAVYRSCEVPAWQGTYVYADYCSGELSALTHDGARVNAMGVVLDSGELVLGTGWNAYGDVFFTTVDAIPNGPITDGFVYRLAPV